MDLSERIGLAAVSTDAATEGTAHAGRGGPAPAVHAGLQGGRILQESGVLSKYF